MILHLAARVSGGGGRWELPRPETNVFLLTQNLPCFDSICLVGFGGFSAETLVSHRAYKLTLIPAQSDVRIVVGIAMSQNKSVEEVRRASDPVYCGEEEDPGFGRGIDTHEVGSIRVSLEHT